MLMAVMVWARHSCVSMYMCMYTNAHLCVCKCVYIQVYEHTNKVVELEM